MCRQKPSNVSLIEPVLDTLGDVPGSLITILQEVQETYGYLPMDVMELVAERTGTPIATIVGVATFYAQFRLEPQGKYLVLLCQGTACHVNGAKLVDAAIRDELGIEDGQTTADGLFTLKHVACLGCCSLSPVMMIGGRTYGRLTPDSARRILRELAAQSETGGDA